MTMEKIRYSVKMGYTILWRLQYGDIEDCSYVQYKKSNRLCQNGAGVMSTFKAMTLANKEYLHK